LAITRVPGAKSDGSAASLRRAIVDREIVSWSSAMIRRDCRRPRGLCDRHCAARWLVGGGAACSRRPHRVSREFSAAVPLRASTPAATACRAVSRTHKISRKPRRSAGPAGCPWGDDERPLDEDRMLGIASEQCRRRRQRLRFSSSYQCLPRAHRRRTSMPAFPDHLDQLRRDGGVLSTGPPSAR